MTEQSFVGEIITNAVFDGDSQITLSFGNKRLSISDEGQSCCEHRYMNVQDDISYLIGKTYLGWELSDYTEEDESYAVHEIQFLNIKTSDYVLQVANHNQHNGYYGGFCIEERKV